MPLYMYQAAYTAESLAAQLKKPENRVEAVGRSVCEAVGGKLVGGWYCFGDYDLAIAPSSRATRRLGSDVSATSARHSRVKTSTIARMQNRRPSANASDRKPGLQRWLGPGGSAKGRRLFLNQNRASPLSPREGPQSICHPRAPLVEAGSPNFYRGF